MKTPVILHFGPTHDDSRGCRELAALFRHPSVFRHRVWTTETTEGWPQPLAEVIERQEKLPPTVAPEEAALIHVWPGADQPPASTIPVLVESDTDANGEAGADRCTRYRALSERESRPYVAGGRSAVVPGVDRKAERRSVTRDALAIDSEAPVAIILPPSRRAAHTYRAAWSFLLVQKILPVARLIVPGEGREVERIRSVLRDIDHRQAARLTSDRMPLTDLIEAADVAIHLGNLEEPTAELGFALDVGVPLLLTEPCSALLGLTSSAVWTCARPSPKAVSRVLLRAFSEADGARERSAAGREQYWELWGQARFAQRMSVLYRTLLGMPVAPEHAAILA